MEKPEESNGFDGIIDFLNASSIKYALIVNPTVYESCIQQFWATAKAKTVNGERQIQALVDKKKAHTHGPGMNLVALWHLLSSVLPQTNNLTFPMFLDKQVEGMSKHKGIYVTPSHTKKIFANMKREGKGLSRRITPQFQTMMVQAPEDMGEDSAAPTDSQPLSSKPQKKIPRRKQRKDSGPTEPIPDTAQAKEIASLKKRVKQLEKRRKSSTSGLKKLRKGRKIANLDADAEVTLIDETQERFDEEMLFDVQDDFTVVTTASATTTVDELTLAQTLIEIKAAKPKAVTTNAITITIVVASTRPKAKGIIFHDKEEQASAFTPIVSSSQLPQVKDKGKGKMVKPEEPLKKKVSKLHLMKNWHLDCRLKETSRKQLAAKLQAEEQEQFSIKEKPRMLVEMIAERKKFFAAHRAAKQRNELEFDKSKKQKIDEHVEAKKDDQEEAEMKRHIEIVKYDKVAIDAIPLATKPLVIVEYKIDKDGRMRYFKLIRAYGSSKRYSSMIKMLQDIDREDLETL
ncbi:hypothetical protein Tco_0412133 [Tanacetum coccineum]